MTPYPTRDEIRTLAASLAHHDKSPFFERVSPEVDWEVMGTHPAAGRYKSLDDWKKGALGVVQNTLEDQIQLELVNVIGGGDQEWAVIELEANAVCKNGMPYPQRYAWIVRFDQAGMIVQAKAYLDSALLQKAVDGNASGNES